MHRHHPPPPPPHLHRRLSRRLISRLLPPNIPRFHPHHHPATVRQAPVRHRLLHLPARLKRRPVLLPPCLLHPVVLRQAPYLRLQRLVSYSLLTDSRPIVFSVDFLSALFTDSTSYLHALFLFPAPCEDEMQFLYTYGKVTSSNPDESGNLSDELPQTTWSPDDSSQKPSVEVTVDPTGETDTYIHSVKVDSPDNVKRIVVYTIEANGDTVRFSHTERWYFKITYIMSHYSARSFSITSLPRSQSPLTESHPSSYDSWSSSLTTTTCPSCVRHFRTVTYSFTYTLTNLPAYLPN